jgi:hypothetical protein
MHGSLTNRDGKTTIGGAGLPPELVSWLEANLPAVPDLAGVNLVFRSPWTGSDGLTLGRTIYLRPGYEQRLAALDPAAIELLCHELTHVEQYTRAGRWWLLDYLLHHREREAAAYQRARELRAMWEAIMCVKKQ